VFTKDTARAIDVSNRLAAGTVCKFFLLDWFFGFSLTCLFRG
jgi:hypothetical protein